MLYWHTFWYTKLKNWYTFSTDIGTVAHKFEKLASFWYFGTRARWHVDVVADTLLEVKDSII